MRPASMIFSVAAVGFLAFVCAAQADDCEKAPPRDHPGRDNPVLKSMLAPDLRITGRWIGVIRRGFEEHSVTIETNPADKEAYRLTFYSWTDTAGARKAQRTGKLVDGVLSLNEPIDGFGVAKSPFSILYVVRADGKDYLLPAVNAEELKSTEDVKPRVAYQFQRRTR